MSGIDNQTTQQLNEFHANIVAELKDYLPKLINALDSISELFYGEMNQEEWGHFGTLIEGIEWVVQSVSVAINHNDLFNTYSGRSESFKTFINHTTEQLARLEDSIQNHDFTSVGDMIKFEFPDIFQSLLDNLNSEVVS